MTAKDHAAGRRRRHEVIGLMLSVLRRSGAPLLFQKIQHSQSVTLQVLQASGILKGFVCSQTLATYASGAEKTRLAPKTAKPQRHRGKTTIPRAHNHKK